MDSLFPGFAIVKATFNEKAAARQKRWREQRVANGQCVRCGSKSLFVGTQHCEPCLEKTRDRQRKRRGNYRSRGICITCGRELDRTGKLCKNCLIREKARRDNKIRWCPGCGEEPAQPKKKRCAKCEYKEYVRQREKHRELRREILKHYGGKCTCCGEATPEFLHIDHIHGGGGKHRKEIGMGYRYMRWIKSAGFPKTLQILCANCNLAKAQWGHCPHQARRNKAAATDAFSAEA